METEREELFKQLFQNSVISENIFKNLSFRDFLAASEVSRLLKDSVRESLRFKLKAVLVVEQDGDGLQMMLSESNCPWKFELIFDIAVSLEVFKQLLIIVPNFKIVTITGKRETYLPDLWNRVRQISTVAPNLTLSKVWLLNLYRLESFWVDRGGILREAVHGNVMPSTCDVYILDLEVDSKYFVNCFYSQLQNDVIGFMDSRNGSNQCVRQLSLVMRADYSTPKQFFLETLSANYLTIQTLVINSLHIWNAGQLLQQVLPALTSLTVYVHPTNEAGIAEFIRKQSGLNVLTVRFVEVISVTVLEAIEQVSKRLESLEIGCKLHSQNSETYSRVHWNFLKQTMRLSSLHLTLPDYGCSDKILSSIPTRFLKELSITGCELLWGLRLNTLVIKDTLCRRFNCLRSLRLNHCHNLVDDNLLHMIAANFNLLEHMEITFASLLTIGGFTGEGAAAISNLTNLRNLNIGEIIEITPLDICTSLAIPGLKTFEYYAPNQEISDEFVRSVFTNNVSLKTLRVNAGSVANASRLQETLQSDPNPMNDVFVEHIDYRGVE